ncbi:hypothetical protein BDN70DRAFT_997444 [Pholiota conissans]|uniref:F-box domain-containing protein n=1 Tax=Pholiota conissans TaxID=109636 RepID=A0A9P5YSH1_9AGAR|nr:hypothetical protein BDN70DRAFT_997444 [Pholiota conissans]
MTILPFDIIEKILEIIALELDDPSLSTINMCSLVCHDWLPMCRKHIFASVILHAPVALDSSSFRRRITVQALHKQLNTSPNIGHYVRDLLCVVAADTDSHFDDPAFINAFKMLPRLQSFRLDAGDIEWNHIRSSFLQIFNISTFSALFVVGIKNLIPADLALCKSLEKLLLRRTTFSTSHSESDTPRIPLRIRYLYVENWSIAEVVNLCDLRCMDETAFLDLSKLIFLSMEISSLNKVDSARALLHTCEHLESLEINTDVFGPVDQDGRDTFIPINLSNIPTLKTLKRLEFDCFLQLGDPYLCLTDELMNMANKNVLEETLITINAFYDNRSVGNWEWGKLDEVFQHPGWPDLRYVSLTIVTYNRDTDILDYTLAELRELVKSHFPKLSASKSVIFMLSIRSHTFTL